MTGDATTTCADCPAPATHDAGTLPTCACGCGAVVNGTWKKGHNGRRPLEQRFWEKVRKSDGCWEWTGSRTTAGYGNIRVADGEWDYAHRIVYRWLVGPIRDGMVIDHLCRNRGCCNPEHLEQVRQIENVRRGATVFEFTGHCLSGRHEIQSEASYRTLAGGRRCRACDHDDALRKYAKVKSAAAFMNMKVTHYIAAYGSAERTAESVLAGQAPA